MSNSEVLAGVGRVDITPPLTAPHANWGAQVHITADDVSAPLTATALVLSNGDTMVAWLDFDLMILTQEDIDAIQHSVSEAIGIAPDQVRISVTHNHAGPPPSVWNWATQGQSELERYHETLPDYAAGAALAARNGLQPVRIGADSGECFVASNRRERGPDGRTLVGYNPGGVIDPEVFVVRIDGLDGFPIATIVGYTMHPTTLGAMNRLVSPDWPGYLKETVEEATGAYCLFAQGACANIGPGPEGFTDDLSVIERLGSQVGFAALAVSLSMHLPPVEWVHDRVQESGAPLSLWTAIERDQPAPKVRFVTRKIALPLIEQPPLEEAETRMNRAQETLDALKAANAPDREIEAATFETKRANMTLGRVQSYGGMTSKDVDMTVLQIGDIAMASIVGEPFVEIGLAIKERSPFPHTWFGGYVGEWAGYIPAAAAYPEKGYEVEISPFSPQAEQVLVDGVVALLNEMAASR